MVKKWGNSKRIAIIDIPIPIVLHNFFSSYFSFSSFEAVLYPEINHLPCPESKIIESTVNVLKYTERKIVKGSEVITEFEWITNI